MSIHAETAKVIRLELKLHFPTTKFKVNSSTFSGGNSVDITWTDGPTYDQVMEISQKYEYGSFNAMNDMYEHTNSRKDIPQVKYVQARRNISDEVYQHAFDYLKRTHQYFDEVTSIDETNDNLKTHWACWTARDYIHRFIVKTDLRNGFELEVYCE